MIQSDMVEKRQGFAELEDVDQATFVRFLQWLYQSYYHAALPTTTPTLANPTPKPSDQSLDHTIVAPLSFSAPSGLGFSTPPGFPGSNNQSTFTTGNSITPEELFSLMHSHHDPNKKRKASLNTSGEAAFQFPSQDARHAFAQRKYVVRQMVKSLPQPRQIQGEHEDYTEVFLGHAYLYVFADKYDIQPLKILALEELHATLAKFTLYPQRVKDVITLLRYVYSNAPEQKNATEDMRTLMKEYVECELDTILKDDGLAGYLMGTEGAILGDIFKIVRKRLARANLSSSIFAPANQHTRLF